MVLMYQVPLVLKDQGVTLTVLHKLRVCIAVYAIVLSSSDFGPVTNVDEPGSDSDASSQP